MKKKQRNLYKQLDNICLSSVSDFTTLASQWWETDDGPLIHIDNGGKILGVAHLDAVMFDQPVWKGSVINCPQLDDRLGAWVLLSALPQMKKMPAFDILLCDSEEKGKSTAGYYTGTDLVDKDYNWIFEFDRAGMDAVLYQYEDDDTTKLLEKYGFDVGMGAFSDISSLEELERKAFNFGVGYHMQHTNNCYADILDTWTNIRKFVKFASEMHDTKLPHVFGSYVDPWYAGTTGFQRNYRNERSDSRQYESQYDILCHDCYEDVRSDWNYCPYCGGHLAQQSSWDRGWPDGYNRAFNVS